MLKYFILIFLGLNGFIFCQDSTHTSEEEEMSHETDEIFINATRSSRTIENEPTRVEHIGLEEIDEKITMDPSGISMILNESTGIQVQQTSAFLGNNTFRIHGLPGKYTQLLRDGFPLYSGISSSLSLLQVPPLDLRQIEVIKGSASTLYGGGAIAGIINLIPKEPSFKRETSFLVNGNSAQGIDLSTFSSERNDNLGYTFLASYNGQKAYDGDKDKYSDIPQSQKYAVNPKLFFYLNEKSSLKIGGSFIYDERKGGSMDFIDFNTTELFASLDRGISRRANTELTYNNRFQSGILTIKNSLAFFNNNHSNFYMYFPYIDEDPIYGEQFSTYSEAAYFLPGEDIQWIFGVNYLTEKFSLNHRNFRDRNDFNSTAGAFVQTDIDISKVISLEIGSRIDYSNHFKSFFLPRASFLFRWSDNFSSRVSGGLGYKFPEDKEKQEQYRYRIIYDKSRLNPERSHGINFDFNYSSVVAEVITFSINQLFFYNRINDVSRVEVIPHDPAIFITQGFMTSRGAETNIKITYDYFKLFAGYTYNYVHDDKLFMARESFLTPRHRLGLVLFYEKEHDFKIGLESYYTAKQYYYHPLSDYWIAGIMAEKQFGKIKIFINFENVFDLKQSNLRSVYEHLDSYEDPLYAPREGRVINGGVKVNL